MIKHKHYIFIVIATMISSIVFSSCKKTDVSENKNSETQQNQQQHEESTDDVVLTGEGWSLMMSDYERCLEVHRIQGRMFSERALANPRFQRDEVQRCMQTKFMRSSLSDLKIEILPEEHREAVQRLVKEHEVADENALASKLEIPFERLDDEINDTILPLVIQRKLVSELTAVQAREMFNVDMRQMTVEIASFDNTPTDEDVDAYLNNNSQDVMQYLGGHQELLNGLPSANFVRLGYSLDNDEEQARNHAEELKKYATEQGLDAAIEKCRQEASQGCMVVNDRDNLYTETRNDDNVWAFRVPIGSVSEVVKSPERYEIRIIAEILPPVRYDIKDPAVIKKVTHEIMRDIIPADHLIAALKPLIDKGGEIDFRVIAESLGGKYQLLTDTLESLEQSGELGGSQIKSLLGSLKPEEVGLFSDPMVEGGRLYIIRVTQMVLPTDEMFAESEAAWRVRKAADPRYQLTNVWLQRKLPRMTTLNIEPIQRKYGILQPNGIMK